MSEIIINKFQYLELEKLSWGAFSPLNGFMNEDEFHSVTNTMRLINGDVFPLPIIFGVDANTASSIRGRPEVSLVYNNEEVGVIYPDDIFSCNKDEVCTKVFGVNTKKHPGVSFFHRSGDLFIGGKVELKKRVYFDESKHELTPAETKKLFAKQGWKTIVGFQTRNVPHRAHEYLQRVALEHVDGLYINPLIGWKKKGDFTPDAILAGYTELTTNFLNSERVVFKLLTTNMRYAGPREAVFHAIIRRNYGCTHFIVGRDHAGVNDYYGKYDAHELTRKFDGELGIEIMRLHGPYYCSICDGIVTEHTCPHLKTSPENTSQISSTYIRDILIGGKKPEPHFMRNEIVKSLQNITLFIEKDEA